MHLRDSIGRFLRYVKLHGLGGTAKRILLDLKRRATGNRQVLFYCDIANFQAAAPGGKTQGRVERKSNENGLEAQDLHRIEDVGYPPAVRRQLSERFANGAALWLFKLEDKLAGFGWTLSGKTMEPHFFPLGRNDVHLFDFFAFPEYRGRRINPSLMRHILNNLALEGKARVFIEAAEWNTAQLHSLERMPFQQLGHARKHSLLGRTIVVWNERRASGSSRETTSVGSRKERPEH